GGAKRHRK
nr:Chain B, Histone H4 residues 20-27 [Homo sapiens]